MTAEEQLAHMSAVCRSMGAEVRQYAKQSHFTAMFWEDEGLDEAHALTVQRKIQELTAQYPRLACYCFDPFSTLVYSI